MKKIIQITLIACTLIYVGCDASKKTTSTTVVTTTADIRTGEFVTNGKISFEAANERYSADGEFKKWHFTSISMNENDIESLEATAAIDLTSVWEKSEKLTNHLKAPDFLDIERFTTATIDIKDVLKQDDGSYTAVIKLKMKGIAEVIKGNFKVTSMDPVHIVGSTVIGRKLYGLGSDGMGVGEYVTVNFDTDLP